MRILDSISYRANHFYTDRVKRPFYPECQITEDDMFIGSFPKSGRTWVRFFFASYVSSVRNLDEELSWDNLGRFCPRYLCTREDGLLGSNPEEPRVVFSHDRSSGRFYKGRDVIFLTRNMSDIIVSYYFFHRNRKSPHIGRMTVDEYARKGFGLNEAISRINYFAKMLDCASGELLVPYEQLRSNSSVWFRKMIEFSPMDFNESYFKKALDVSSFSSMREKEKKQRPQKDKEAYHARGGRSGDSSRVLAPETVQRINAIIEQRMDPHLMEYYRN